MQSSGKWADSSCSSSWLFNRERRYVCETQSPSTQPPTTETQSPSTQSPTTVQTESLSTQPSTTVTIASSMQCQAGWTRSGMSCYRLVSTSKRWDDAETDCISKGGHLASIASVNENSVVLSLRGTSSSDRNDTWIGLHDQVVKNASVWFDGTSSTYTNWDTVGNEPNDSGDCVRIRSDGKWKDHRCTASYPYVCEYNLTLSTTQTPTTLSASTSAVLSTSPTTAEGALNCSTAKNVTTFLSVTIPSTSTASLSTATASGTQWQTRDSTSTSRRSSVPVTTTDSTEYAKSSKTSRLATTSKSNVKPSKGMIHLTRAVHPTLLAVSTPSQASTNKFVSTNKWRLFPFKR
ncbi:uncharacterized protein LOC134180477 isoform X2 [Corticium candelabrum]|uniref:uncharacterized protein LOC134180477 isoform X2 n=1 Tax=Corticium candelabrum TaxID=121492 RepID=UPI002E259767|nr:uncharacterized protein LOC134180477 isoform X2 [Corticium candelabrum]